MEREKGVDNVHRIAKGREDTWGKKEREIKNKIKMITGIEKNN
jgi:hypothetical protein